MSNVTATQSIMNEWDGVWKNFKNWKESVHTLAVKTVLHVYQYRNATVIIHALDKMEKEGKGSDKKALVDWFQAHSPCDIQWDNKAKAFKATMLNKDKADVVKALNEGKAKKWYDYAKPVQWNGWSIDDALQGVLTQGNSAMKKAKALHVAGQPVPEVKISSAKMKAIRDILAMPDEVLDFGKDIDADNGESEAEAAA